MRWRNIAPANFLGSVIGSGIELYEYVVYANCLIYFAPVYFPSNNANVSFVLSLGAFFAGFMARPLGAAIFGYFGDTRGRRNSLALALLLTAMPTLIIGLLPGYDILGFAAPLLIITARMVQSIGFGGEFAGAAVFLSEHAGQQSRYVPAALVAVAGVFAGAVALGFIAILETLLGEARMAAWGWRVPFLIATVLIIVGFIVRRRATETPVFAALRTRHRLVANPLGTLFYHYKGMLICACLIPALATQVYLLLVFMPSMAKNFYALSLLTVNIFSAIATLTEMGFALGSAWLAERIGARKLMISAAAVLCLGAWPLFSLIVIKPIYLLFVQIVTAALIGIFHGPMMGVLINLFPAEIRYIGVSIAYNISYALFAGLSPMLAALLLSYFSPAAPALLFIACSLIAISGLVAASHYYLHLSKA